MGPIELIRLYHQAMAAYRYAQSKQSAGLQFAAFGRSLGWKLLRKGHLSGISYLLTPVNIVRYFEFPYALSCLPPHATRCLDIGSPRLFSLYVGTHQPTRCVTMINPDSIDAAATQLAISTLGLRNVSASAAGLVTATSTPRQFDCIWAISVIEHIHGTFDDMAAIRHMYDALASGGRLILSVPVDRQYREDYRADDPYGIHSPEADGQFFFQRVYDLRSIMHRLLEPINAHSAQLSWFGENEAGHFAKYETLWRGSGHSCTVHDPREIVDHFRNFSSWTEMPGQGVCGIVIDKPIDSEQTN